MAKGVHVPDPSGADAAYISYTAKVTAELRAAARRGQKISAEVVFRYAEDYNTEGREEQARMNFFQTGFVNPLWLLERLQAGGFRQYWRTEAVDSGRALAVGGVMRVTLRYHDKWTSTFERRKHP